MFILIATTKFAKAFARNKVEDFLYYLSCAYIKFSVSNAFRNNVGFSLRSVMFPPCQKLEI